MLKSVHIENIALIKSANIDFSCGFSAFTGETGAGKSIIVDSIGFGCGARAAKDIIRSGESRASVELLFDEISAKTLENLSELGVFPDEDGCIYISRTLDTEGKSAARINSKQVPISLLRACSCLLINIHGQHDNTLLLDEKNHIDFIDSFCGAQNELAQYKQCYIKYCDALSKLENINTDEKENARRADMLKYQIEDIESAKLKVGEYEKLSFEKKLLANAEKISRASRTALGALYDNPQNAYESVNSALSAIKQLSNFADGTDELYSRLESVKYEIEDIAGELEKYSADLPSNPTEALDKIETRLELISKLIRKYGQDEKEVIDFCTRAKEELETIENFDEFKEKLEKELENIKEELSAFAKKLTEKRIKAADVLSKCVEKELAYLDMPNVKFSVTVAEKEFSSNGADDVSFAVKLNSGEPFKSLAQTASGGELSRIMLALLSAFSEKDGVSTLIFDEIDTGISGKTSRRIGLKLRALSKDIQVLSVTHSAQIASLANTHYLVKKEEIDGRTQTFANSLSYEERTYETARIIAGIDITQSSLRAAKELIDNVAE